MNSYDFDYVVDIFGNQVYIQYNWGILDGMDVIIKYVGDFVKLNFEYIYDVKYIYVDGDFVIFQLYVIIRVKY